MRDKVFLSVDCQGTRITQGVTAGNITVPTLAQGNDDFLDPSTSQGQLAGSV